MSKAAGESEKERKSEVRKRKGNIPEMVSHDQQVAVASRISTYPISSLREGGNSRKTSLLERRMVFLFSFAAPPIPYPSFLITIRKINPLIFF